MDQSRAPIHEALEKFRKKEWYPLMCRVIKEAEATKN